MSYYPSQRQSRRRGSFSGLKIRLLIGAAILLFSVVSYLRNSEINPVTGQKQRVGDMTVEDEIVMGLRSVEPMARQHGGFSRDERASQHVRMIGARLLNVLELKLQDLNRRQPYRFDFHLLADDRAVNAFALPGGQVFITTALYNHLGNDATENEFNGRLAGVIGHEIGHVLERHSAERMAKGGLLKGLVGAAGAASGSMHGSQAAASLGDLVIKKYGRNDELESDRWGIELMILMGFDPRHMLDVMNVLEQTAGGGNTPEFMSTHPRPANRRGYIQEIIGEIFPQGVPDGLR